MMNKWNAKDVIEHEKEITDMTWIPLILHVRKDSRYFIVIQLTVHLSDSWKIFLIEHINSTFFALSHSIPRILQKSHQEDLPVFSSHIHLEQQIDLAARTSTKTNRSSHCILATPRYFFVTVNVNQKVDEMVTVR